MKGYLNKLIKSVRSIFGWYVSILLGLFILILAFLLRFINLVKFPIFADEAIYIRWAQVMKAESTLRFLPLSDGKQPLFMWSVIPFLKIFNDPLFAGRIASVLSGLGTITGIYILCLYLFKSKKTALVAAFIYCLSPFSVFFDRLALVDSMLALFAVWSGLFMVLVAKTLRFDCAFMAGFTLGFAWLTKSPAVFFLALSPTSWLLSSWPKKKRLLHLIKLIFLTCISLFIAFVIYNILRLGPNFHLLSSRNLDYIYPLRHIFENPIDPFIPHLKDILGWLKDLGPLPLLLMAFIGSVIGFKTKLKEAFYIVLWLIFPLLVEAMYAKVFTARYILFTFPFVAICASLIFLTKNFKLKVANVIIFLLFIIFASKQNYLLLTNFEKMTLPRSERSGYLEEWTAGYGLREIADYIRGEYLNNQSQKIVVGTDGYFGTMPDGLQIYLNDLPQITVVGVEVRFIEVPKPLLDSFKAGNKTYLVVNSSRFYIKDVESAGLKLIKSFPKAVKPDGSKESHLFFQVVSTPVKQLL